MPCPKPALALAAALLAVPWLAGCGAPSGPSGEIVGSTGILFEERPVGSVQGADVVWDVRLDNPGNATSAPAQVHMAIKSSRTGLTTERSADVAPIPGQGSAKLEVRTPYDGAGDYSGVAEVRVGASVVARALVFFEQCNAAGTPLFDRAC